LVKKIQYLCDYGLLVDKQYVCCLGVPSLIVFVAGIIIFFLIFWFWWLWL